MNKIVLCRKNYKSLEEFNQAISSTVKLLLDARYIMTVRYDEPGLGIVVIDFDYDDRSYGGKYPYWLTEDERLLVEDAREDV